MHSERDWLRLEHKNEQSGEIGMDEVVEHIKEWKKRRKKKRSNWLWQVDGTRDSA